MWDHLNLHNVFFVALVSSIFLFLSAACVQILRENSRLTRKVEDEEDEWVVKNYATSYLSERRKIQTRSMARPGGTAKKVFLSVRILRMDNIDESADTFDLSMLLFLIWKDEKLTENMNFGDEISEEDFENNKNAFKPNITMPNMKEGMEDFWTPKGESRPKILPASLVPGLYGPSCKKIILQVLPVTGTFNEEYELKTFPFDVQKFHLIFRPKEDHRTIEIRSLIGTRFSSTISAFVQDTSPGFSIFYPRVESQLDTVSMNRPYSILKIVVVAERKSGFFVYTFYSMLIMIQLCTFMLFAGDFSVDNRFPNLLTLLLTITALKFVANEILPRISYTTLLDQFMFVSLGQLFLCCLESFLLTVARDANFLEAVRESVCESPEQAAEWGWSYDGIDAYFAVSNLGLYFGYLIFYVDKVLRVWYENAFFVEKNNELWIGTGHDDTMHFYTNKERASILKRVNKKYGFLSPNVVRERVDKLQGEKEKTRESITGDEGARPRQRRSRCLRYYFGC